MSYPLFDFGGSGQIITVSIANGFPPETYLPLFAPLTARYRVVAPLPRPLREPATPPESLTSWHDEAADLLEAIREQDFHDVIGVGHSMGGVFTMLAAIRELSRFKALIFLDPTFLPPVVLPGMAILKRLNLMNRSPLVAGTERRRRYFDSTDAAYDYWRGKPLFADWSDETLRHYAQSMTRWSNNGSGMELAWTPEWEASYYRLVFTEPYRELRKLRGKLPVLAIQGKTSNTFVDASVRAFRRALPEAQVEQIKGHGHLFPQAVPDQTRTLIEEFLGTL